MVPYYPDRVPDLRRFKQQQQSTGTSSMLASIVLDKPPSTYTNLDFITGKVVVTSSSSVKVSSIVVKLEGESRSRLMPPTTPQNERPRPVLEFHKILYKVQMVFPPPEVMNERIAGPGGSTYTLPPGQHEYPFRFKVREHAIRCRRSSLMYPATVQQLLRSGKEFKSSAQLCWSKCGDVESTSSACQEDFTSNFDGISWRG